MHEKYKKILIINTFGIGDVLFATPMVRALKRAIPNAHIDLMCNQRCRHIVRNNRNIDDILVFEKDAFREAFRESKIKFVKKMSGFLGTILRKKYDLAIDLSLGYQISLLLKLLGVKRRVGFNYRDRGRFLTDKLDIDNFSSKHVIEYYLSIPKLLGIDGTTQKNLEITLSPQQDQWADDFVSENKLESSVIIGIAPGGGKSWGKYAKFRRWDPLNFAYVAKKLTKENKDLSFLIFGSRDEKSLGRKIEEAMGGVPSGKCLNLCGKLSLPHSIALIKKCRLLLCNDGGLLHIAVSQAINTISIFGPVDDKIYGPYPPSSKHKVAKAEGVKCRPCYKNFKHKMCGIHDCLIKIDKDKVLKLAKESIEL